MTTREELRRDGAAMRARLFAAEAPRELATEIAGEIVGEIAPGLADLFDELIFGAVWRRPGLALPDRMIAALAALCAVQRLVQLRRHVVAALDLGLSAQAIVEVFIQCGIYAGFPASEEAIGVARAVFAERGLSVPVTAVSSASFDELMAQGRALMEELHGTRGYEGYAAPDNKVTGALYPLAIQYGYGEIWHRPGLERRQRALCAVAAFTALRLEGQVRKFGQSALNAGLSRGEIIETVIQTGPYSAPPPSMRWPH